MSPGNPYATQSQALGNNSPLSQIFNNDLLAQRQALVDPNLASGASASINQLNTLAPELQKMQAAQSALQGLEQSYSQAGGGQGLLGGLLSKLGGLVTGGPANAYGSQAAQAESQLKALGIPTGYIPQLTDTAPVGQQSFGNLQNIINSLGGGGVGGQSPVSGLL
jgi:hypothetical protein